MTHFDLFDPTETHQAVRQTLRHFVEAEVEPQAKAFDEAEKFNEPLFRRLGSELSLFGLTVPESDGGVGLDPVAAVIVCEELSRSDPGLGLSYLAHEVLFTNNFYFSSNVEQRERFLGGVLDGSRIAGMAMTEPEAGTDVLGMRATATRRGDRYLLNGTKQFCTNGTPGDLFLVYAKTRGESRAISAFVVERESPGFSVGKKEEKLGMRASPTSQLVFEDCEVPAENLLGEENGALVHMMRNLEIERVTLAAQSVGIALRCVEEMARYAAAERKAFGRALIEFGQMQSMIARSYAETHAARALVYQAAHQIDPERRQSLGAASAKLVATPTAERVARRAIQVYGGYGYTRDYPVERLLRDAILLSIGGGTVEAMEKNIASELARVYR
jgi:isovaleryl-CoA dehydrogenase